MRYAEKALSDISALRHAASLEGKSLYLAAKT